MVLLYGMMQQGLTMLGKGLISFQSSRKEEKSVTFLSYDGAYGQTDKVLNFIQQDHKFQKF